MEIRVIRCARDSFWYSSHIGESFEVIDNDSHPDAYKVWRDKKRVAHGYVFKSDAELVEDKILTDTDKMVALVEWLWEHGMLDVEKMDSLAIVRLYEESRIEDALIEEKNVGSNSKG
jgi:hypothetical protein